MRQIKFRAWDAKNKKFAFIGFHILGEVTMFNLLQQYTFEEGINLVITQFTGLVDRDGVEVYEGDILTFDEYPYTSDGEINYIGEIYWCDENAAFYVYTICVSNKIRGISEGNSESLAGVANGIIIGNVYANPELLKRQ